MSIRRARRRHVTYFGLWKRAYKKGDWTEVIRAMQEIIKLEPQAADAYYYIGEAYRFQGGLLGMRSRRISWRMRLDPDFGPPYVGMARARLSETPMRMSCPLLDQAIRLDPNFGEAYLERAIVKLRDDNIPGALADLGQANRHLPGSPLVYFHLAQARLRKGNSILPLVLPGRRMNWM